MCTGAPGGVDLGRACRSKHPVHRLAVKVRCPQGPVDRCCQRVVLRGAHPGKRRLDGKGLRLGQAQWPSCGGVHKIGGVVIVRLGAKLEPDIVRAQVEQHVHELAGLLGRLAHARSDGIRVDLVTLGAERANDAHDLSCRVHATRTTSPSHCGPPPQTASSMPRPAPLVPWAERRPRWPMPRRPQGCSPRSRAHPGRRQAARRP